MAIYTLHVTSNGRDYVAKNGSVNVSAQTCSLVTRSAHNDYVATILPFQKVRCELSTRRIKSASFELVFHFYDAESNKLLSKGGQKIAMVEHGGTKLLKFPEEIINKVRYYVAEDDS